MVSVFLGLLAAFCWSSHDLLARNFAGRTGPTRMSFWIMLAGAALLVLPVFWRGLIWQADGASIAMALAMGLVYAVALGTLLLAFSLAPVSIVGPLTAGYPALVVVWGLVNGLVPSALQGIGIVLILVGVMVVSRTGDDTHDGPGTVAPGKMPLVIIASVAASFAFAAAVVMGQAATHVLGEYEVTFLSRFPAALALLPFMLKERRTHPAIAPRAKWSIVAMAACDTTAVTAINAAAHFPNREMGAMAISSYGAMAVVMAMVILKEKVSRLQWLGIGLVVLGVAGLSL